MKAAGSGLLFVLVLTQQYTKDWLASQTTSTVNLVYGVYKSRMGDLHSSYYFRCASTALRRSSIK